MTQIWIRRLRVIAAGLSAVTLAALGLAGILYTAGDSTGGQALCGAASVCGLVFVINLSVLAVQTMRLEAEQKSS
jgi:hypothetical protein